MKRILIANDILEGGGVENVLYNIVSFLITQGDEIYLLIPQCTQNDLDRLFGGYVKCYPSIRPLKKVKRYTLRWFLDRAIYVCQRYVYRLKLSRENFDVLIALKEGGTMKELSKVRAKKKIGWVHVDYNLCHWTKPFFMSNQHERKCMMRYDKVICVSKAAQDAVINTIGDPGNLCVKYNPIDFANIRIRTKAVCSIHKPANVLLFVSVGRLSYEKNYAMLIDICNDLSKSYLFELWIVGDGPQKSKLQEQIEVNGITNVRLLGAKKNPFPYLVQADVFVSSSRWESYGLAIQEALVLGKPVIAMKCPAIEETLNSKFGILTEPTQEALSEAIESILFDPTKLEKYRSSIQSEYKTEDLYEKRLREIYSLWM